MPWLALILFAVAAARAAPPSHSRWTLAFSDEFEGDSLDGSKWSVAYAIEKTGPGSWNDPANVRFGEGRLKLYGEKRPGQGKPFAGAAITTRGKFAHRYGYMEAAIRMPRGKGFSGKMTGVKPGGGVPPLLDIVETRGEEPNRCYWYLHADGKVYGDGWNGNDLPAGFHLIGTEWNADELILYVDGAVKLRSREAAPSLRLDICWALELMVGGSDWIGIPDASTPWPGVMEVDWVRVWRREGPAAASMPARAGRRPGASEAFLPTGRRLEDPRALPGRAPALRR